MKLLKKLFAWLKSLFTVIQPVVDAIKQTIPDTKKQRTHHHFGTFSPVKPLYFRGNRYPLSHWKEGML
jgi:hypothetical protein